MKAAERFPDRRTCLVWELLLPTAARIVLSRCAREEFWDRSREACGLLLGRSQEEGFEGARAQVQLVTRCANVANRSTRSRVELDPGHLVRGEHLARARGLEVLGTWHAHPDEPGARALSALDLGMGWKGAFLVVVVARAGQPSLVAWRYADQ